MELYTPPARTLQEYEIRTHCTCTINVQPRKFALATRCVGSDIDERDRVPLAVDSHHTRRLPRPSNPRQAEPQHATIAADRRNAELVIRAALDVEAGACAALNPQREIGDNCTVLCEAEMAELDARHGI